MLVDTCSDTATGYEPVFKMWNERLFTFNPFISCSWDLPAFFIARSTSGMKLPVKLGQGECGLFSGSIYCNHSITQIIATDPFRRSMLIFELAFVESTEFSWWSKITMKERSENIFSHIINNIRCLSESSQQKWKENSPLLIHF